MKTKLSLNVLMFMLLATTLQSCDLIGGIFKAGMWTGVIAVFVVVGLIIYLITRAGRGRNS